MSEEKINKDGKLIIVCYELLKIGHSFLQKRKMSYGTVYDRFRQLLLARNLLRLLLARQVGIHFVFFFLVAATAAAVAAAENSFSPFEIWGGDMFLLSRKKQKKAWRPDETPASTYILKRRRRKEEEKKE